MPFKDKEKARKNGLERATRWREKNPEYAKEFYQLNKEEIKKERDVYRRTNNSRYSILKAKAKVRGIQCLLSFEQYCEVVSSRICDICGGSLPEVGCGIDRIDSNIGYIIDNVRPCCTTCNQAKNAMSDSKFMEWILKVYNRNFKIEFQPAQLREEF